MDTPCNVYRLVGDTMRPIMLALIWTVLLFGCAMAWIVTDELGWAVPIIIASHNANHYYLDHKFEELRKRIVGK